MRISDWSSDVCSSDLSKRSRPASARATSRLTARVVLPTPPLVFPTANIILLSLRWLYGCAVAWFVMLRDIHLIGALIPPRRPHLRCRRPAALAHLAVILDRDIGRAPCRDRVCQ